MSKRIEIEIATGLSRMAAERAVWGLTDMKIEAKFWLINSVDTNYTYQVVLTKKYRQEIVKYATAFVEGVRWALR